MREIKFRAWQEDAVEKDLRFWTWKEMLEHDLNAMINNPKYKIMQYTGLKDVNGREIYEGDIVKAWNRGVCGTFQVKWRSDGVPMYILFPAWQKGKSWNLYNNGSGIDGGNEVIGNVFENPELLKEKN